MKAKAGLPTFQWHEQSGSFDECVALKHHLTASWVGSNADQRTELAKWIVADWGGVRANRSLTLESHLSRVLSENSTWPLQGLASYSKILTAVSCTQYAIYDARVAACLNAVQLIADTQKPVYFPYVPSRNKLIQAFTNQYPRKKLVGDHGWTEIEKDNTYRLYLEVLHHLKRHFADSEVYHFEMTLFSLAPLICSRFMDQHA
ncbi:hypothetical protein [Spirosoma validum]|uniref:Uncharacterized protein n=1 Tax=Spirosoma validum TaxID=2771355 RepID=A0A927GGY4_9BACT|nr:hypothetical protein [Spirosoma validum]MBD2757178.1 hypothetical protein [Spirosoma validum]